MNLWKVQNNGMMGDKPFAVYRKRNVDEVLHSGNMEFGSDYMASREAAQAIADKLNAEERSKSNAN